MLSCTLNTLEIEGPAAITARRIAADANSSTAAVYELFGDKQGVVRSMFLDGFRRLAEHLEALDNDVTARADVVASLNATRSFAVDSPALFTLMYQRPFVSYEPSAADLKASQQIYDHLVGRVAAWLGADRRSITTIDAAHALISMNRGLIANELAGVLGRTKDRVQRRRYLALDALLDGLQKVSQ